MSVISDPVAVRFLADDMRPWAVRSLSVYWEAKQLISKFRSDGFEDHFPATGDTIEPTAPQSGQVAITSLGIHQSIAAMESLVASIETVNPQVGRSMLDGLNALANRA